MPKYQRNRILIAAAMTALLLPTMAGERIAGALILQDRSSLALTPIQAEIEKQNQRLGSADIEDRRDALMRLRALQHRAASRVAVTALSDAAPIVRATAAGAVLWLPASESAAALIPLLNDKEEFVRQQSAYALGETGSPEAVNPLVERLSDKKDSVRGAAAVALGQIADAAAVTSLAAVLDPRAGLLSAKGRNTRREQNRFVLRAAARSLGQIGNRAAVPALVVVLQDDKADIDVRRESAFALGVIGDPSALKALREADTSGDAYLAKIILEAIRKISSAESSGGS